MVRSWQVTTFSPRLSHQRNKKKNQCFCWLPRACANVTTVTVIPVVRDQPDGKHNKRNRTLFFALIDYAIIAGIQYWPLWIVMLLFWVHSLSRNHYSQARFQFWCSNLNQCIFSNTRKIIKFNFNFSIENCFGKESLTEIIVHIPWGYLLKHQSWVVAIVRATQACWARRERYANSRTQTLQTTRYTALHWPAIFDILAGGW